MIALLFSDLISHNDHQHSNARLDIQAARMDLEAMSDFCYLGSYISYNGSCEKDVRVRIGRAAEVFLES